MRIFKRGVALASGVAAVLAGSVAAGSPAMAASSPVEACGGGSYHVIDSQDLGSYARIYLLYNGSTNCVVTWAKSPYAGTAHRMEARIRANFKAPGWSIDSGSYKYYAGPVKVKAPGTCIQWGGAFDPGNKNPGLGWSSGWSHCG